MSKEFKINLLKEMDLLYAKIHRLEDVCEQANIMLNQRDEIEEGLNKRIAELEAEIDQLTADSTDERKDDKLPEREVCEACGGDGTLLLVDNYKGQATATVDCPYCNGTGRVNKECEK